MKKSEITKIAISTGFIALAGGSYSYLKAGGACSAGVINEASAICRNSQEAALGNCFTSGNAYATCTNGHQFEIIL